MCNFHTSVTVNDEIVVNNILLWWWIEVEAHWELDTCYSSTSTFLLFFRRIAVINDTFKVSMLPLCQLFLDYQYIGSEIWYFACGISASVRTHTSVHTYEIFVKSFINVNGIWTIMYFLSIIFNSVQVFTSFSNLYSMIFQFKIFYDLLMKMIGSSRNNSNLSFFVPFWSKY